MPVFILAKALALEAVPPGHLVHVLPLVIAEAGGEDQPVLQVDGLCPLGALVSHGLLLHVSVTWIHAADLPVLAREQHLTSVPVPTGAQHQLGQSEVEKTFTWEKIF